MNAAKKARTVVKEAQERLAAAGGKHIGDLASWNATRVDVPRETVTAIFAAEGFAHLVPNIEPAGALMRAVGEVSRTAGVMVRPFAKPHKDSPLALGFYVQQAKDGESGDDYICGARVRISVTGTAQVFPPENAPVIAEAYAIAEAVADRANHLIEHAKTRDVSNALVAAIGELRGIPLRDRGGFYLLPVVSCETWRRLSTAVEQLGFERILIEMHDAPSNVKVAAQAAKGSLENEIAELKADLDRATMVTDGGSGMKRNSLERRVKLCDDLVAKAELYRNVLADAATTIEDRIAKLRAGFARQLDAIDADSDTFTLPLPQETA